MAIDFSRLPDRDNGQDAQQKINLNTLPDKKDPSISNQVSFLDSLQELFKTFGRTTLNNLLSLPSTLAEAEARDIEAFPEKILAGPGFGRSFGLIRGVRKNEPTGFSNLISDAAKISKETALEATNKIKQFVSNIEPLRPSQRIIEQRIKGFDKENLFSANNIERALQIGSEAFPSLITALGISAATRNPFAGAAVLGLTEGGQLGREAEEAGANAITAANVQAASTIGSTLLEVIPINDLLTGSAAGSSFLKKSVSSLAKSSTDPEALNIFKKIGGRAVIGFIEEGSQEGVQQLFNNLVAKIGFDKTRELTEGIIDSIVGGAITGTAAGVGIGSIDSIISDAKEAGATDQDINQIQSTIGTLITANESSITKKLEAKPEIVEPAIRKSDIAPEQEITRPITSLTESEQQEINNLKREIEQTSDKLKLNSIFNRAEILQRLISTRTVETLESRNKRLNLTADIISQIPLRNKAPKPKEVKGAVKKIKSFGKQLDLSATRPSRIFDAIDGEQNFRGPAHRIFIDSVNAAEDSKERNLEQAERRGLEILQTNNLTDSKLLGQVRTIDNFEFTLQEIMHLYAARNNPENIAALMFGNKIPLKTIQNAINTLTENEKQAADQIAAELTNNFGRVRDAFIQFKNGSEDIEPVVGNYIPMLRDDPKFQESDVELGKEFDLRNKFKSRLVNRKFTLKRQKLTEEEQSPIRLGLIDLYFDHVAKREQFIHFGSLVRDLRGLTSNRKFANSIKNNPNLGPEAFTELNNYLDRVADPRVLKAQNAFTKTIKVFRQNAAVFFLGSVLFGGNPTSISKQLPSYVVALNDIKPLNLISATEELANDFKNKAAFVKDRAPQVFRNTVNVELQELKRINPSQFNNIKKRISDFALRNIVRADQFVKSAVWLGKYNELRQDPNISDSEAVRQATNVVLRTQPAAKAKDLPSLFANENIGLFIQFANQLNQNFNVITKDIPRKLSLGTNAGRDQAVIGGLAMILNFALIWSITNGRFPTDEEDLLEIIQEPLSIIPALGSTMLSVVRGFDPGLPPALQVVTSGSRLVKAKSLPKAAEEAVNFIGLSQGLPLNIPKRLTKTALRRIEDETTNLESIREALIGQFAVERGTKEEKEKRRKRREKFIDNVLDTLGELG